MKQRAGRAKRAALILLACLLAPIVAIATISFAHQPSPPAPEELQGRRETALSGEGKLLAGAAAREVRVPPRGPIAGYPLWRRDDGSGESISVRALVLQQGPLSAVLISMPLLMIPGTLEEEIVRRAGVDKSACLTIAATHTHSGPGGTWKNALLELGGNGLYAGERVDAIAQAAADAVVAARAKLAPARVAGGLELWTNGPSSARSSGAIDPALAAARVVDSDGRAIATVAVYAMHATVIPHTAHGLSGDWPEAAARALEQASGAPALILQGAEGNATYARADLPADPAEAAKALGARVAAEASRLVSHAPLAVTSARLSCSTRIVALPEPESAPALNLLVRRAAGNLLRLFAPRAAIETTLSLPGLELIGIPGEPAGELSQSLRLALKRPLMLVGLADGYVGYIESADHWKRRQGKSFRTWYGPHLAEALSIEPAAPGPQRPLLNQSQ